MVPAQLALELALFPAILMALAVVREKELGSITNLYVTPVTRLEFLLGKQVPYVGLAMVNFALMFMMALFVFQVPLKGSFPTLLARRADLRHRDDGLRHADLGLRPHPDRGAVRHRDPDRPAGHDVCRHDGPGVLAVGHGADHGPPVPDDLLPAGQRRHLHEGPRLRRPRDEPGRARALRPGADDAEPRCCCASRSARPTARCEPSPTSSGSAPRSCAASCTISCCWGWSSTLLAGHHRAGAKQFAGSAQRVDRASSTRTIRNCRDGSRMRSCRPTSRRRSRSPSATSSR